MSRLIITVGFIALGLFLVPQADCDNSIPGDSTMGGAYAMFAGKFGGEVTKNELNTHSEISISGCAKGSTIISYKITVDKAGVSSTFQCNGGKMTDKMLIKLRSLKKGDTFIFKGMTAQLPQGGVVNVWCKVFTVV